MKPLLAALLLAAVSCMSHATDAVEQLRGFLTQTQSARGEFTQRVETKTSAVVQQSSGTFIFQRPGKFRWTYLKPYEQLIVSDGQRLFLFDKDLNQVTVKTLAAALPASPASILFGSNQFEKDFEVIDMGTRQGLQWVGAKPRGQDSTFEKIEIGFKDQRPAAMTLRDSFGQTTHLVFVRFERNAPASTDTFKFTPPQGADVLQSD